MASLESGHPLLVLAAGGRSVGDRAARRAGACRLHVLLSVPRAPLDNRHPPSDHPPARPPPGTRGIAPVRAALSWTPLLAHAGSSRVAVFQLAPSQAAAPYLLEWDTWREAGVQVHPLYLEEAGGGAGPQAAEQLLEQAVFGGEHGLAGVLGGAAARDAAVLMSGLEGEAAAGITRALVHHGIPSERVMVCEY